LLSENRTPGEIEGMVERYATKLRSYFALRVNLREIDERLKRSQEDTDRHMLAAQSKLRSMGFFDESLAKQGSDFKPIDLFRRGAETGIEILSKELQPYRNRRTRLNELAQGNAEAQRNLKEVLEPAHSIGFGGGIQR
jgi:ribosome modulation factor